MAKNRNAARETTPSAAATTQASSTSTSSKPASAAPPASAATPVATAKSPSPLAATTSSNAAKHNNSWEQVVQNIASHYIKETPQRTKLLDAFMAFLVAVGALQFLYCVLAGNYPFNAFLSGFSATVGQFVLTAALRIQTTEANKSDFPAVSPERAFADFVFCSLILHFFCVNFIN
ncbi:DAD family-domain-containing protein [Cercophora scortea]|uniref:Dolichyl-diphosphooligosaccharide--protein glycosyltransferase subunit OST2 n=1 Tax=Cercophora scortea TaxID=314031 RepID=A0AAE0MLP7_9PEZI|nr:DAD family-domain-containing protein [Cercophora scortea]